MSDEKINSKIILSNKSSFTILVFVILKFRNIGRSTFEHSKFCTPPTDKIYFIFCFLTEEAMFS